MESSPPLRVGSYPQQILPALGKKNESSTNTPTFDDDNIHFIIKTLCEHVGTALLVDSYTIVTYSRHIPDSS